MANKNYNTRGNLTKPKGPKATETKSKVTTTTTAPNPKGINIKPKGPKAEGKPRSTTSQVGTRTKLADKMKPKRKEKMFGAPEKVLKNKSKQSFGEAFKAAKKAGVKEFEYNGKKYAAVTKDEVKKAGFKDGKKDLGKYLNTKLGNKAR